MTASWAPVRSLKIGEGAGVIDVGVAVDHDLDVLGLETELADRVDDHRAGRGHAGVHQDVPFRGRDQEGAESLGADEIERADDVDRLRRLFPLERLARQREEELVVVRELFLGRPARGRGLRHGQR